MSSDRPHRRAFEVTIWSIQRYGEKRNHIMFCRPWQGSGPWQNMMTMTVLRPPWGSGPPPSSSRDLDSLLRPGMHELAQVANNDRVQIGWTTDRTGRQDASFGIAGRLGTGFPWFRFFRSCCFNFLPHGGSDDTHSLQCTQLTSSEQPWMAKLTL